jgi:small redox-active disulfide protein 2
LRKVHVLGTGCPKCKTLLENTKRACSSSESECEVIKVEDINEILGFGVMMTPALVIDGEVKAVGKVLSEEQIREMIETKA